MAATLATNDPATPIVPPDARRNLAAFRAWALGPDLPEKARVAYINGEVWIDMAGEQVYTHARVKGEVGRVVANVVHAARAGVFLPDGVLVTNEDAHLSDVPDAVFLAYPTLEAGRVEAIPGVRGGYVELLGTPDWVLEVVSDSSVRKDTELLLQAYHAAGIPEYWVIDCRGERCDFSVLKRGPKGYTAVRKVGGWAKSAAFGKSFRLVRGLDPLGHPEFTLEVK